MVGTSNLGSWNGHWSYPYCWWLKPPQLARCRANGLQDGCSARPQRWAKKGPDGDLQMDSMRFSMRFLWFMCLKWTRFTEDSLKNAQWCAISMIYMALSQKKKVGKPPETNGFYRNAILACPILNIWGCINVPLKTYPKRDHTSGRA